MKLVTRSTLVLPIRHTRVLLPLLNPLAPPPAGCVTVVCSDKTGTLTENELTATEVYSTRGQHAVVRGEGGVSM